LFLLRAYISHYFSGNAHDEFAGRNLHPRTYDATASDNAFFSYLGVVLNDRIHSHEDVFVKNHTVQYRPVSDVAARTQPHRKTGAGMDDTIVLHIRTVRYVDIAPICTQAGAGPDKAPLPDFHSAN
jgi:hypothetical protein